MWTAATTTTTLALVRRCTCCTPLAGRKPLWFARRLRGVLRSTVLLHAYDWCLLLVQATAVTFIIWRAAQWFSSVDAESHFEASQHFLEDPNSFEKVHSAPKTAQLLHYSNQAAFLSKRSTYSCVPQYHMFCRSHRLQSLQRQQNPSRWSYQHITKRIDCRSP